MANREEREQINAIANWFKANGKYIVLLAVLIIGWYAGNNYYKSYTRDNNLAAAEQYQTIVQLFNEFSPTDAKAAKLENIQASVLDLTTNFASSMYSFLASLELAKNQFLTGDTDKASANLQWIIDNDPEPSIKMLAKYRLAKIKYALNDLQSAKELLQAPSVEFEILYNELLADIYSAEGKYAEAIELYDSVSSQLPEDNKGFIDIKKAKIMAIMPKSQVNTKNKININ